MLKTFVDDLRCSGASLCVQDAALSIQHLVAVQRTADGRRERRYHYATPYLLWEEGQTARSWNSANARLAVVPWDAFDGSEPYADLLATQRAGRRLDVLRVVQEGMATCLALFRSGDMDDFGPAEEAYLDALKPHLRRATRLNLALADLRATRKAQMEVLDRLPFGTLVLDFHGRVLQMNRSTKHILSKTDALKIRRGRLAGALTQDTVRLEQFFGKCAGKGTQPGAFDDGLLSFSDSAREKSVLLVLAPTKHAAGLDNTASAVTGFVFETDHHPRVCRSTLKCLYGLTAAESLLVEALVSGDTLESAAGRFGISKQTARKQLSTIYLKTDTHRQAELMKLVLSGPAIINQVA